MRALADFAIAAVDFARIESQRFRRGAIGAGILLAMCFAGAMLVFLGFAAILAAMFMVMAEPLTPPVAAIVTGFTTIALAGVLLWITKRLAL